MKTEGKFRFFLRLAIVPLFAGALFAQSTPDKILVVNGKTIGPAVREMDGHSYVDIDTLAQAMSGNVTVEPNRVLLAFPIPAQVGHRARRRAQSRRAAATPGATGGAGAFAQGFAAAAAIGNPGGNARMARRHHRDDYLWNGRKRRAGSKLPRSGAGRPRAGRSRRRYRRRSQRPRLLQNELGRNSKIGRTPFSPPAANSTAKPPWIQTPCKTIPPWPRSKPAASSSTPC